MDKQGTDEKLVDERFFGREDMLIVLVHELIMVNKKHNDGKTYVNLPISIKKLLANATCNVTKNWNLNTESERMNWWGMKYGNLRHAMGETGLSGVSAANVDALNAARKHFENNKEESIKIGFQLLHKSQVPETLHLLSEMGLSSDDWMPHIKEHGQEPILNVDDIEEQKQPPLFNRIADKELDSFEEKALDEMRKLSERFGGVLSKTEPSDRSHDEIPRLKIWSGIPGTGKSFQLQKFVKSIVKDEAKDVFRTVFHPEYSMYDFVGQIRPTESSPGGTITYPFEPGPFTRALKRAVVASGKEEQIRVFLIIEELNRGNAAAIFGEIFQLLDFNSKGESQYGIVQNDIASVIGQPKDSEIRLPPNLHIYATMNISDQNVFPLDTAFLRRWDREYVFADTWEGACTTWEIKPPSSNSITWKSFAETLNNWLINHAEDIGINHPEDKRLGPWFVDERTCNDPLLFANKLLTYLWTNVFAFGTARERVFNLNNNTLEGVLKEYSKVGLRVFSDDLFKMFDQQITKLADADGIGGGSGKSNQFGSKQNEDPINSELLGDNGTVNLTIIENGISSQGKKEAE